MNNNVIGYTLYAHDNDTEMYPRASTVISRCPICGARTELFPHNPKYVFQRNFTVPYSEDKIEVSHRATDCSCTYDGQFIVTKHFKDFCEKQAYSGLRFLGFNKDKYHFQLIVTNEVEVNTNKSNIRYEKQCPFCELCEWVGPTPEYYDISTPLPDGFYRSDLIIGPYYARHPQIIVGAVTMQKILDEKFKGIIFDPIFGA